MRKMIGTKNVKFGARIGSAGILEPLAFTPQEGAPDVDALRKRLWSACSSAGNANRLDPENFRQRATSPTILFDTEFYAAQLPWFARGNIDPLDHYLGVGWALGLSPHIAFDAHHLGKSLHLGSWTEPPLLA